ncbi:type II toxin-antitoxin system HicA family toxin [Candidatus Uhrbacteria bacterium]|nr:type II toxin-antitoxin system HicA family toxin [Candidatus Uhrbacteria bacterium]
MAKTFSGKTVITILCRTFGFFVVSQKGSHVKLRKRVADTTITTIIPLHRELSSGTLKGILQLAQIEENDFRNTAK